MTWTDEKRRRQLAGRCASCDAKRGANGTTWLCRPCADRKIETERRKRASVRKSGLCLACGRKRGEDGTGLRCRPCADENARDVRRAQKGRGAP